LSIGKLNKTFTKIKAGIGYFAEKPSAWAVGARSKSQENLTAFGEVSSGNKVGEERRNAPPI
jgi:hypothetical protein